MREPVLVALIAIGTVALMGPVSLGLAVVLVVSYALAASGTLRTSERLLWPAALAVVVQAAHFAEELGSGFQRELPSLAGAPPWSLARFALFNGAWLVAFAWAAATRGRSRLGLAILGFLALGGGLLNGVAHVLLAIWRGGYFPGLATAPICGAAGAWLLWTLLTGSGHQRDPSGPGRA
jgi:Protein of unknown function with HXXEE motif